MILCAGVASPRAEPAAASGGEPPPVVLRFYYLSYLGAETVGADPAVDFLYRNGRETTAFHLGANALSAPIEYRGPVPVELFRERKTERGVELESLGRLEFPPAWRGAVFLVVPTREAGAALPFRFVPIEYGGPGFADNHVRLVNLCAAPLAARLAEGREVVAARGHHDFAYSEDADTLFVRLALRNGERWRTVMSSLIPTPAQKRLLMLAVPGATDGNVGSARVITVDQVPR